MSVPFLRFLVFPPALQISSGSFGFMKLLLRGNVVSYNGTLIILNRSTSTFRLNERSRTRVYPPEKRGRKRMRESSVTKRKTALPKRNIVFVEYLVDWHRCQSTNWCLLCATRNEWSSHCELIKSRQYIVAGIINGEYWQSLHTYIIHIYGVLQNLA